MNKVYLISDTHFNHKMLIENKFRPFKTIEDMNNKIICNWNTLINENDKIYHLGDIVLNNKKDFDNNILPKLNGNIIFVKGNHDPKNLSINKNIIINYLGYDIELVHRPQDCTGKCKIVLHGHIHKTGNRTISYNGIYCNDKIFLSSGGFIFYNCNLEFHKYKPILLNNIIGEINYYLNNQNNQKVYK